MPKRNVKEQINEEKLFSKELYYKVDIKCKNEKQKEFLRLLKNQGRQIVFGIGAAGSGKSYISLAYAIKEILSPNSRYKTIILINPTVESGNMNLGFIKGTLDDKTEVYRAADAYTIEKILEQSGNEKPKDIIRKMYENDILRYELMNFARGKNYDNALILLNESENFSKEEMLLLLTRIGENSKVIVTGDPLQKDRKDLKKCDDGLSYAYKHLSDLDEVAGVVFENEDIVRNPLISKIIDRFK